MLYQKLKNTFQSFKKNRLNAIIEKNRKEVVGFSFFIFMLVLGNYTIFASSGSDLPTSIRIPVLLRSAEGITQGTLVYIYGIRIGHILSLTRVDIGERKQILSNEDTKNSPNYAQGVVAILSLSDPIVFYPNYRVITKHTNILAPKVIEILPGDTQDWDKSFIPGVPFVWSEDQPKDQAIEVLELSYQEAKHFERTVQLPKRGHLLRASNYNDPIYLFAITLTENKQNLFHVFQNFNHITAKINHGQGSFGLLINSPELSDKTNGFLEEAKLLTSDIRDGLEAIRESDSFVRFLTSGIVLVSWWLTSGQGK